MHPPPWRAEGEFPSHPLLKPTVLQVRAFQFNIAGECLNRNTLVPQVDLVVFHQPVAGSRKLATIIGVPSPAVLTDHVGTGANDGRPRR